MATSERNNKQFSDPPKQVLPCLDSASLNLFSTLNKEEVSMFHVLWTLWMLPAIAHVVNTSLSSGKLSYIIQTSSVTPLLKRVSLNPSHVNSYRPVSPLPFL